MRHNLRAAIFERFGTQLRCAEKTDIHFTRLSLIIRGWVVPTPIERDRLTAALGAEPQWLFATGIPAVPTAAATETAELVGAR